MLDINWVVIPLSAGVVGYVTNALAIRMLFRPFKPHWYTLGWQGIIPRTRGELAINVAKVVGERLVTVEEIDKTLSDPEVQATLQNAVSNLLRDYGQSKDREINAGRLKVYLDILLNPLAESIASDDRLAHTLDVSAATIAKEALVTLCRLKRKDLGKLVQNLGKIDNGEKFRNSIKLILEQEIKNIVFRTVNSGKSIGDLLPVKVNIDKLSYLVTEQIRPLISDFLEKPQMADRLSDMIIDYKNSQFSGKMADRVKLGAINVFFYDEKIQELVHTRMPEVVEKLNNDPEVLNSIKDTVEKKLNEILSMPISTLKDKVGDVQYYAMLHTFSNTITDKLIPENVVDFISEKIAGEGEDSNLTVEEIINSYGARVEDLVPDTLPLSFLLTSDKLINWIKDALQNRLLSNFSLTAEQTDSLSIMTSNWIISIMRTLVPQVLRLVNITALVEQKINSLDLKEVEDLLFSFMKAHFKWINILGFIIGFIVGFAQVAFIHLTS